MVGGIRQEQQQQQEGEVEKDNTADQHLLLLLLGGPLHARTRPVAFPGRVAEMLLVAASVLLLVVMMPRVEFPAAQMSAQLPLQNAKVASKVPVSWHQMEAPAHHRQAAKHVMTLRMSHSLLSLQCLVLLLLVLPLFPLLHIP
jgi:hypothetical protein